MQQRGEFMFMWVVLLLFVGVLVVSFIQTRPTITGLTVFGFETVQKNWTFDSSQSYIANASIEFVNGTARLAASTVTTTWNETAEYPVALVAALYDPKDRTSKVDARDNVKIDLENNKIFDIFLGTPLENGDVVSLYITDGKNGTLFLCDEGRICSSPSYGAVSYDGGTGWYNITLSALDGQQSVFNLRSTEEAEIDFITSSRGNITKALSDPSEKTTKVSTINGENVKIDKAKLFNILFNSTLEDGDVVRVLVSSGDATSIYLCGYGETCPSPGYGTVSYTSGSDWYNITLSGLSLPLRSFNLDPTDIHIDAITALHPVTLEYQNTTTTYPLSADVQTADFSPDELVSWGTFTSDPELGRQEVAYHYSTDSGASWATVPADGNLSSVNGSTIRFRAVLLSNGTVTHSVNQLAFTYTRQFCTENWTVQYGVCGLNDVRVKYYNDVHECGTTAYLPPNNGTLTSCDYCALHNCTGSLEMQLSSSDKTGSLWTVNATSEAGVLLEINSSDSGNITVGVVSYSYNPKNVTPSAISARQYIDVDSPVSNISSMKIVMRYNDSAIQALGINEEKMKIYLFNETTSQWTVLESVVDTTANYVYSFVSHNSFYGLFGESSVSSESSPGSSGSGSVGGGGGGGGSRQQETLPFQPAGAPIVVPFAEESAQQPRRDAEFSLSACTPSFDVEPPEEVSFVTEQTFNGKMRSTGDCEISDVKLALSPEFGNEVSLSAELHGSSQDMLIDFVLERKGGVQNNLPGMVTGSVIGNLPFANRLTTFAVNTLHAERSVSGWLTLTGSGDGKAFSKQFPLTVHVFELDPTSPRVITLGSSVMAMAAVGLSLFVVVVRRYRKRRKAEKLS